MKQVEEPDHLRTLTLPSSLSYQIDRLLDAMSWNVVQPCEKCKELSEEHGSNSPCAGCKLRIKEHKIYLIERLLEAITDRKLTLWNWQLTKSQKRSVGTLVDYPHWSSGAYILKDGAVRFCESENTRLVLEEQVSTSNYQGDSAPTGDQSATQSRYDQGYGEESAKSANHEGNTACNESASENQRTVATPSADQKDEVAESRTPNKTKASVPDEQVDLADYKKLAEAFSVHIDENTNLNWFKERCGNYRRYKGFEEALVRKGERGGNPARFNVLLIAVFLLDKNLLTLRTLKFTFEKHFPELMEQFDTYLANAD